MRLNIDHTNGEIVLLGDGPGDAQVFAKVFGVGKVGDELTLRLYQDGNHVSLRGGPGSIHEKAARRSATEAAKVAPAEDVPQVEEREEGEAAAEEKEEADALNAAFAKDEKPFG